MNVNQKIALFTLGGVTAGAVGGYFYAMKSLERKYAEIAEEEIASVKDTYELLTKKGKYKDDRAATDAYLARLDELQYRSQQEDILDAEDDEDVEAEEENEEVEAEEEDEEEVEPLSAQPIIVKKEVDVMKEPRDPKVPYLIHVDEFMNEREDHEKLTINYYVEDDTLADERDEIIPDVEGTVGTKNLDRWGDGSDSIYSVYVRNERLSCDFEVLREDTSYAKMMLGEKWENQEIPVPRGKFRKMPTDE